MKNKNAKHKTQSSQETVREEDLLPKEDLAWLRDMQAVLSPYWSSRSHYAGHEPEQAADDNDPGQHGRR